MEHFLLLASLGLALIVAVGSFLLPGSGSSAREVTHLPTGRSVLAERLASMLPFLGYAVTLPTHKPFAAGQGLGFGYLIGGLGAVLLYHATKWRGASGATSAGLALVAATVSLPLLLLRPVLLDALMGVAIGWFTVVFLMVRAQPAEERASAEMLASMAAAGFATLLSSAAYLGTLRDPRTLELAKGTWSAIAVSFASGLSLLTYLVALVRPDSGPKVGGKQIGLAPIISLGIAILIACLLAFKVAGDKPLFVTILIGLLVAPLTLWLRQLEGQSAASVLSDGATIFKGAQEYLVILLLVSGFMVGTQMLLGFGAGIFLVALWSGSVLFVRQFKLGDIKLLLFGSVLLLYRLYLAEPSTDLHGANVTDQYALFGFIVGAAAPSLIAAIVDEISFGAANRWRPVLDSVIGGLLTLAAPAFVVIVFGPKCVLALILGSAIGIVFGEKRSFGYALIALGMALALDQFDPLVEPYADLSRLLKLKVLAVTFALLLVLVAVSALKRRGEHRSAVEGAFASEAPL